jgi:UDP-glucose:(heptosyl)LPS alpha-1,3-glucosyltransferase
VRIPTPRRPFAVAYPAFFALASYHVARRHDAIVHTTGAIVANRADVSTVHYCHRSAVERVDTVRATRPGPLYWLNATACSAMSLWAEAWCYRPGRTRLLCAVSTGLAAELDEKFPVMRGAVRTVPNGVDVAVFRPDPAAGGEVRAELGVHESAALAVFAGGDWERKRLGHAVDALAFAPGWHLVVAGAGDPEPQLARARAAGTESRLHFLGPVTDMPRIYAAGDAFVLPTSYEAFPLVVLEAAASGLPLLVTRVNGVEDILQEGRNGWFIAPDGRDIARRLNELRADPELAGTLGASARSAAAGYSWEAMRDGYLALYAELAGGAAELMAANR